MSISSGTSVPGFQFLYQYGSYYGYGLLVKVDGGNEIPPSRCGWLYQWRREAYSNVSYMVNQQPLYYGGNFVTSFTSSNILGTSADLGVLWDTAGLTWTVFDARNP